MIEREFIAQKTKEYYIKKFIEEKLQKVGISQIKLKKIPLGEKIIIDASRPRLIVGSKGTNIKDLTKVLKKKFKLENPQIEINEVRDPFLDATIVAERISSSLERFGSARFKGVGHKMMTQVMNSGAYGVEIMISGKIPGARAKSWRFYMGYLKKCGDVAIHGVRKAYTTALLKSGIIGIKVAIMPPDLELPDSVKILEHARIELVEKEMDDVSKKEEKHEEKKTKKRAPRKKKEEKVEEVKTEEQPKVEVEEKAELTEEKQEANAEEEEE